MRLDQLRRSRLALAIAAAFLSFLEPAQAQSYTPGVSYYGRSNYIEYIAGELPVIFSAPHGGTNKPAEIPDRTYGTLTTDANTEDLARKLRTEFGNRFGLLPHVVMCRLDRNKIDCNREIVEGAQGDPEAETAWNEFHDFMSYSVTNVTQRHGRGFYFDIHGHGHAIQRLELGYLLSDSQLNLSDDALNGSAAYQNNSSIRTLSAESPQTFAALLRGSNSFGGLIGSEGYPSVPSPATPGPGADPYFNGGYNTDRYGSDDGGNIDALQIESHYIGVRSNATDRTLFSQALARTVESFFLLHYGVNLRESLPKAWVIGGGSFGTAANWLNGYLPVSTNHLLFAGAGGNLSQNLGALTSGTGVIGSITFSNAPTGSYHLSGNAISLLRGITNNSGVAQTINNSLTLAGPQSFAANAGPLVLGGNVTNGGHHLQILGSATANGILSGAGGLTKSGAGTLALTTSNSYGGGTIVSAGTLLMHNPIGSGTGTGFAAVSNGATLGGTGTISGPVTCSGTLSPGISIGALTFLGGLDLAAGGTYLWELASPTTAGEGENFDHVVLNDGNLSLAGTSRLQLSFPNAAATPSTGDPFWLISHKWKIISSSGSTTNNASTRFTTILNGNFPTGTFTNHADVTGNVWLDYVPVPAAPPVIQSFGVSGGNKFALSFTTETNRTYVLQSATNLLVPNWEAMTTNIAPGMLLALTNLMGGEPMRFFRVLVVP